jgi:hypothetical protein
MQIEERFVQILSVAVSQVEGKWYGSAEIIVSIIIWLLSHIKYCSFVGSRIQILHFHT